MATPSAPFFRIRTVNSVNTDGTVDLVVGADPDNGEEVIATGVHCTSAYPERAVGDSVLVLVGSPIGNLVLAKTPMLTGWTDVTP